MEEAPVTKPADASLVWDGMSTFHLQVSSADSAYVFDFNKAFGEAHHMQLLACWIMRVHGQRCNTPHVEVALSSPLLTGGNAGRHF